MAHHRGRSARGRRRDPRALRGSRQDLRRDDQGAEATVNLLGYFLLLQARNARAAIEVFRYNVELYRAPRTSTTAWARRWMRRAGSGGQRKLRAGGRDRYESERPVPAGVQTAPAERYEETAWSRTDTGAGGTRLDSTVSSLEGANRRENTRQPAPRVDVVIVSPWSRHPDLNWGPADYEEASRLS